MFSMVRQLAGSRIFISRNIFTTINFKSNKKFLDYSKVPKVDDKDLEVQYVRGSGPGGQSTNKTSNCVVMKHIPTNIVVKCHETRSQFQNEKRAKEHLISRLDKLFNGEDSIEEQGRRILKKKSLEKQRRQKKMAALKASFKETQEAE